MEERGRRGEGAMADLSAFPIKEMMVLPPLSSTVARPSKLFSKTLSSSASRSLAQILEMSSVTLTDTSLTIGTTIEAKKGQKVGEREREREGERVSHHRKKE